MEAQGDAVIRPLEVWYTHASFFAEPISSLTAVARRLLERGIAYAVFSSEGQAWWADPPVLKEDWWGARRVGQSHSTQVWIPASEDELVVRAGVDASRFAGQEQLLFNDTFRESTPYIRVFCDQCGLQTVSPTSTILFRPQIKLYDNGVVLIHLALECEQEDVSFPDLIDNLVNLQAHSAQNLVVPPGVLLAADELSIVASTRGVAGRAREIRERRVEIASLIAEHTSGESGERHRWAMGVSQSPDGRWMNADTLYDLYDFYRDGVASCVNLPHGALSGIARGRSALKNPPSVFWHARPSVHMVDPVTGLSEYLTVGSAAALQLGRLLARSSVLPAPVSSQHDANLRPAKDYLFFHNQALTVFVYGSEFPMESDRDEEIGSDDPAHETVVSKQALVESLQYLHVSLEALGQRAFHVKHGLEGCFTLRKHLLHLSTLMRSGSSGEVNSAIDHTAAMYDFDGLSNKVREVLDQVSQLQVDRRNYRLEYMGVALTLLLLLASTPSIADAFVVPVVAQLTGWRPAPGSTGSLVTSLIVFVVLSLLVLLAWQMARRQRK